MPSLIDIRRRIRSVKSTQQITRAMKLVSAAKLRRAQDRVLAARPYAAQMLASCWRDVARRGEPTSGAHPLLGERAGGAHRCVLITADRAAGGRFNSNLIKAASSSWRATQGRGRRLDAVGRKGRDFFRRAPCTAFAASTWACSETVRYATPQAIARRS